MKKNEQNPYFKWNKQKEKIKNFYTLFFLQKGRMNWVQKQMCAMNYLSLFVFVENNFFTFRHVVGIGFPTRRPPPPVLATSLPFSDFALPQPPYTFFALFP